ncbi:protein transparent testa 12 [Phtheirospermum japonicum]|uniref:Protein transparent testa 12 n=1 Tax=Phtheirospermum japonicum TaxID=374723 RepID=A0A830D5T5_9LAMI|nr:protein transparent testa 12 [Phtheirospermum japonicum]
MVSTILAYWIPSFGQLVYVMFGGCPDTWTGFTTFAFKDLGPMIKLSLSSGGHDLPQHKWLGRDDIYRFHEWSKSRTSLEGEILKPRNSQSWGRLAYFFTKSEDVAEAVASLSPLLAFTILLNGVQPVLSGVANGAGRQGIVAYVNLGSYYLIGIPLGVILGYVIKLQVQVSLAHKRINRWFVEAETSDTSSNKHSGAA